MRQLVKTAVAALTAVGALIVVTPTPAAAGWAPSCPFRNGNVNHTYIKGVDAFLISPYPPSGGGYTTTEIFYNESCQIGKAQLAMQSDGNLVVYDENHVARWAASWSRPSVLRTPAWQPHDHPYALTLDFQSDRNLVMYDDRSGAKTAYWASDTTVQNSDYNSQLAVQSDGNVVIYDSGLNAVWQTKTYH